MEKEFFLKMLEEEEIKNKIIEIIEGEKEKKNTLIQLYKYEMDNLIEFLKLKEEAIKVFNLEDKEEVLEVFQFIKQIFRSQKVGLEKNKKVIQEKVLTENQLKEKIEKVKDEYQNLQNELNEAQSKNRKITIRLEEYNRKNKKLETNLESYNQKNEEIMIQLRKTEEEKKNLNKKVTYYRDNVEGQLGTYNSFLELSERAKNSLKNIFKSKTIDGFVACGVQKENIDSLWEYIKNEIIEGREEDIRSLKNIFDYLFGLYSIHNPNYIVQNLEKGNRYDTDKYIRHSQGKSSGEIKEVYLYGYEHKSSGRVIKKSVVLVG